MVGQRVGARLLARLLACPLLPAVTAVRRLTSGCRLPRRELSRARCAAASLGRFLRSNFSVGVSSGGWLWPGLASAGFASFASASAGLAFGCGLLARSNAAWMASRRLCGRCSMPLTSPAGLSGACGPSGFGVLVGFWLIGTSYSSSAVGAARGRRARRRGGCIGHGLGSFLICSRSD